MTVDQLLQIPSAELAQLTDDQLAEKLTPLFPQSRAAYVGPRTQTVMVGDKKVSKNDFAKRMRILDAALAQLGAQHK